MERVGGHCGVESTPERAADSGWSSGTATEKISSLRSYGTKPVLEPRTPQSSLCLPNAQPFPRSSTSSPVTPSPRGSRSLVHGRGHALVVLNPTGPPGTDQPPRLKVMHAARLASRLAPRDQHALHASATPFHYPGRALVTQLAFRAEHRLKVGSLRSIDTTAPLHIHALVLVIGHLSLDNSRRAPPPAISAPQLHSTPLHSIGPSGSDLHSCPDLAMKSVSARPGHSFMAGPAWARFRSAQFRYASSHTSRSPQKSACP